MPVREGKLRPAAIELPGRGYRRRLAPARGREPIGDDILLLEVLAARLDHGGRWGKPNALPLATPGNGPGHDPVQLGGEFVEEVEIPSICCKRRAEGDEVQATTHRLVDRVQRRLMVADDDELEARSELEEVLPHEARADQLATGRCHPASNGGR